MLEQTIKLHYAHFLVDGINDQTVTAALRIKDSFLRNLQCTLAFSKIHIASNGNRNDLIPARMLTSVNNLVDICTVDATLLLHVCNTHAFIGQDSLDVRTEIFGILISDLFQVMIKIFC